MKKMKYMILCAAAVLGGTLTSCNTLDIENLNSYDENSVWVDDNLATAYVNNLYAECFANWTVSADQNSEQEAGMPFYEGTITLTGGSYKKWSYNEIRHINVAIRNLESGTITEAKKKSLLGQVYFMRAYMYYWMVIYHGGVPYITVPQDKDKDDLFVHRNSTAECFDLMIADIDKAITMLPEKIAASSADYGRIDQCFAKAQKAKILLYKASPQFNPGNMYNNVYWKEAYAAAKEAYEFCVSNGTALNNSYDDIWLKEQGPEVVFPVVNANPNKVSNWESQIRPSSMSRSTPNCNPTWALVKAFPMKDGKSFDDPSGKYYVGKEQEFLKNFWDNRDPRFASSVLSNGDLYPVAGRASNYRQYTSLGIADTDDVYGINPEAHVNAANNDIYTGFFIRKASDVTLTQEKVTIYDIDYILMRFAEVMFIYAEAANETGHSDVAVDLLKQIRKRAGIEAGADGLYGLKVSNREEIRKAILDERNVELCFEGHRFLDLRRTRNMMQLDKLEKFGVEAIAINPDGTDMDLKKAKALADKFELLPENFRYVIRQVPLTAAAEKQFVVKESFYFFPIQKVKIDENMNLEQNNNWGGTFNPTME